MATGSWSVGTDKSIGLRQRKDRDGDRKEVEGEIEWWWQSKKRGGLAFRNRKRKVCFHGCMKCSESYRCRGKYNSWSIKRSTVSINKEDQSHFHSLWEIHTCTEGSLYKFMRLGEERETEDTENTRKSSSDGCRYRWSNGRRIKKGRGKHVTWCRLSFFHAEHKRSIFGCYFPCNHNA